MPVKFIPIGSRLVSPDRQPPYDETPDFHDLWSGLTIIQGRRVGRSLSSFGTHMHAAAFDFKIDNQKLKRLVEAFQETGRPADNLDIGTDVNTNDKTYLRNDGRVKRAKQTEPGYVNLTRIKRR